MHVKREPISDEVSLSLRLMYLLAWAISFLEASRETWFESVMTLLTGTVGLRGIGSNSLATDMALHCPFQMGLQADCQPTALDNALQKCKIFNLARRSMMCD